MVQRCWGGKLAPAGSFSNLFGPLESPRCLLLKYAGCTGLFDTGLERLTAMGPRLVKKITKVFFRTGLLKVPGGGGGELRATVNFFESVSTVGKPKVSTSQICMAVLGFFLQC